MRFRPSVVLAFACALVLAMTASAAASGSVRPPASFMKPKMEKKLAKKGAKGVTVPAAALNTECPGVQSPGVSAAGCIVAPHGCTANFIFTDGASQYVGTARHCVDTIGQEVTMQLDTTTIGVVGTVSHMTSGQGEPGNDWALVRIDLAVATQWGVNPAITVIGGPKGVYTGCDPTPVAHYGHGYGVAVAQGKPEFGFSTNLYDDGYGWTGYGAPGDSGSPVVTTPGGPAIGDFTPLIVDLGAQGKPETGLATNWYDDGYGWTGFGAPGDSGSPVLTSGGQAAGDFTHLIVDLGAYPGSDLAGTRITKAMNQFGVSLVNADGTTTGPAATSCGNAPQ
jgi:hypothetical protein